MELSHEQTYDIQENMNILIAADIFPPEIGGPATYASMLAHELTRRGHSVTVQHYYDPYTIDRVKEWEFRVIRINSRRPLFIKYFIYCIHLAVHAVRADVVYAMGPVNAGLPALIVTKILRKKFIIKIVGDYAWEQAWVQKGEKKFIEEFQGSKAKGKIGLLQKIERLVSQNAHTVIVPCLFLKKIIQEWKVDVKKIKVIYNAFSPVEKKYIDKEKAQEFIGIKGDIVLSVCRLTPWKGYELLIDIWSQLLKKNPLFKLVIAGGGQKFDYLTGLVAERGLSESIILLGNVPRRKLPLYYQAADIFVLNSAYEGLPHVILEALFFNLPVITSNAGGNSEVIEDGFNGIVVEYNDAKGWLDAIVRVWKSKSLREHLTSNHVLELKDFSFDHMVDETEKVLQG